MNETKLKERITNAFDAFFDDEKISENTALEFSNDDSIFHKKETSPTNYNLIWKVFKQVFFFLPSATLLFLASVGLTFRIFMIEGNSVITASFIQLILLLGVALTTIFGLGDLRNPKHLSIPLSIFSMGALLGTIGVTLDWLGFGNFLFYYIGYFIPLAFIVPVLVKGWVDKPE